MGLGLSEGGDGVFVPFLSYSAKDGKWTNKVTEGDETFKVEMKDSDVVFVADFDNVEVGWFKFEQGVAPESVLVKVGQPMPEKPKDFKSGFRLLVWSEKNLGGVREWSAASNAANAAMNALYAEFERDRAANPGKLPVVKFTGSEKVGKHGNRAPKFAIVQWTDRPAAFDECVNATPAASAEPAAITPATQAPPPPPPPAAPVGEEVNF